MLFFKSDLDLFDQNVPLPVANAFPTTAENRIVASSSALRNITAKPVTAFEIPRVDGLEKSQLRSQEDIEHERTADWLEKIMMGPRIPDAMPTSVKNKLKTTTHSAFLSTNLTAYLPRETEALMLFKYYVDYVSYLYYVIIPSQVQAQINAIYQSVHNGQRSPSTRAGAVDLNHLALLFSILATATYFQDMGESECTSADEKGYREYTTLVAAALTQSDYMNYPTVEGLQAAIIVSQFLPNNGQDTSVRAMFHVGALAHQCRIMGLLQLDSAQNKDFRKKHGFDPVELEIKRRLVWSVVSTDWLLSYMGGPQEGSYLIQPSHMAVDYPANIPDEEIGKPSLPDHVPTTMSYFIFRLKLSECCRQITDYTCRERLEGIDVPYSKIMALDQKWNQYYKEVPDFFRMDSINRRKYAQLYKDSPQIAWQRLMIQQGYHSRLCRLHRSYFIRGARDPKYSYSHIMCLSGARRVIEIKRIMDKEFPNTPSVSLAWTVIHHDFMAAVILLMDVCFNWDDILAEKRKEEVIEACQMLDRAQRSSKVVREGINAMMDVLRGHWVPISSDQSPPPSPPPSHQQQQQHYALQQQGSILDSARVIESTSERKKPGDVPSATPALYNALDAGTDVVSSTNAAGDTGDLENLWSEFLDNGAMMAGSPSALMDLLSDLNDIAPTMAGMDSTFC
ncbi:hypothetical protein UA08_02154 [Talaromyces atroroseus]|uniref:Xylanolytic transcriptional activator regulatory domain-containing protein n=1 Tax=Talaromyces atroroseus TaxID=1441469 RepID=A0A225B999_TALAT|nr:hypothetical protein UA08_02154 [Talaromyces atroroseus]OKL62537.1 hypothetical protein UA08_02154 [Talaromyces atroroseus]